MIVGAMLGAGPMNPFAALLHRLLEGSRFTTGRRYRMLWGHHRKPRGYGR